MEPLTSISVIRALMERHGFRFSKAMGQNFIVNPGVCPKIVAGAGIGPADGVLEIGPGIGVLTAELAKTARKVAAVELDRRLPPLLAETLAEFDNVRIVQGDVMELDLAELIRREFAGMEVAVCANLPYYITSPVIMRLLEERLPIRSVTVMVQKEAAQRICAPLPSRQAGAITASISYYARPGLLFQVSKGSFLPAPKVDSAVIRLDLREKPPVEVWDEAALFRVIRGAFAQRRKTILNGLSAAFAMDKGELSKRLSGAGVSPSSRAEQLTLADFAAVANALV